MPVNSMVKKGLTNFEHPNIDEQTEVAALFKNRGRLFGEGNMVLEINALDPMSEEIGLTMAYSNGDFDFRADRMTLTDTAAAKLVVKF